MTQDLKSKIKCDMIWAITKSEIFLRRNVFMTQRDELKARAVKVIEAQQARINRMSVSGSFRDSLIEQYLSKKVHEAKDHGEFKAFIFADACVYGTYPVFEEDVQGFCQKFNENQEFKVAYQKVEEGYIIFFD